MSPYPAPLRLLQSALRCNSTSSDLICIAAAVQCDSIGGVLPIVHPKYGSVRIQLDAGILNLDDHILER